MCMRRSRFHVERIHWCAAIRVCASATLTGRSRSMPFVSTGIHAFGIDRNPVLRCSYVRCAAQGACRRLEGTDEAQDDREIVGVTYEDASAYCRWRNGRLPTPDQWEIAGRGNTGFLYPWGNKW